MLNSGNGTMGSGVIYENSYALIVGIDNYEDTSIRPLNYAVADAEAIAELIQRLGFPEENITVLTNEEVTRENFIKTFTSISEQSEENDRLLVYWAGHGESEAVAQGEEGYLIPYDAEMGGLAYSAISMDMISSLSRRPQAKHQLFLVDACYGGLAASTRSTGSSNKQTKFLLDAMTQSQAIQIITAGGKDQMVVESPLWGHSAFTKAILEGLDDRHADFNKDHLITSGELFTFLKDRVVTLSSSVGNNPHYPIRHRFDNAEGEFIFVTDEFYESLEGAETNAGELRTELPEWYLKPPIDTEEWFYTSASGETLREALIEALHFMAGKIETEIKSVNYQSTQQDDSTGINLQEIYTNESEQITAQQISDFSVYGVTKLLSEEVSENGQTSYSSFFSSSATVRLELEEGFYEMGLEMDETQGGGEYTFNVGGTEEWSNLRFEDVLIYLEKSDEIKYKTAERKSADGGSEFYLLLQISNEVFTAAIDSNLNFESTLKTDSEIYEEYKNSEAYKQLMKDLNADSTGNDQR